MLENEALRGDTVIDTLVNMSSDEMREDTVVKMLANIADGEVPDDVIGALLAAFGAPESLRGETVVEKIENIVREAGVTDDVPDDFIGALLMLGDVSGDTTGVNLFAVSSARDGYILSNGNYTNAVNDNHPMTCEYIAVKPGQSLVFQSWVLESPSATSTNLNLWMAYAFYDSDKKAITSRSEQRSGTLLNSGYRYNLFTLTAPEGAAYFRGCCRRVLGGYAKIEYGTEATLWTPSPQDVAVVINEASVCSASNAYSMPLLAATVFGKSVQDGTPTPSDPVDIESVDTLSLVMHGKNLFDATNQTTNKYINVNGTESSMSDWNHSGFIPVVPGTTYTFTPNSTSGNSAKGAWYASNTAASFISSFASGPQTVISPNNARYVRLSYRADSSNIQLEVGGVATTYEAYVDPSIATIDLDGHELRSLPDGTRDLLTVDINGNVTLIQQVERYEVSTTDGNWDVNTSGNFIHPIGSMPTYVGWATSKLCNVAAGSDVSTSKNYMTVKSNGLTLEQFIEAADGTPIVITLALATPVVHNLSSVALPALPAPKFDVWADTDVPTTLTMRYLQA